MNVGQVGASPQMAQPQFKQVERVEFNDDSGRTFKTFENVSATRPADTNQARTGFGIDLNGDGRYNKNQDGLLALDMDGDGKDEVMTQVKEGGTIKLVMLDGETGKIIKSV